MLMGSKEKILSDEKFRFEGININMLNEEFLSVFALFKATRE